MPPLPTSIIIVALIVAWLVVLVPMVAKRRERVPENIEESETLRVLDRDSASPRRRRVLSRTAMLRGRRGEVDQDDGVGGVDGEVDGELDGGVGDGVGEAVTHADGRSGFTDQPAGEDFGRAAEGEAAEVHDRDAAAAVAPVTPRTRYEWTSAAAVEPTSGAARAATRAIDEPHAPLRAQAGSPRDAVRRAGRGGFNPQEADRMEAYRFRQRRRVALALALIGVVGVGMGMLGVGYGYATAIGGGVLLVLYLAYLRRQVGIEADIRARRMARMARARQIRPDYQPSVAEQVRAHRTGELPRPSMGGGYRVKSHVRPSVDFDASRYGVPVDFEDSDPAFDDLEYYRPAIHRRRAG